MLHKVFFDSLTGLCRGFWRSVKAVCASKGVGIGETRSEDYSLNNGKKEERDGSECQEPGSCENPNAEEKDPSLDLMHVINRWAEEELDRQAESADGVPRSPKPEEGIPFETNVPAILKTQALLILRMAKTLGLSEQDFNRLVLQAIFRLAAYVELLPASKQHHHREAGGLFRHSLEVAFEASQMSKGVIFSRTGSTEEIDAAKTRWSLACFLVGLCHDVGKIEANLEVYDRVSGSRWNPFTMSLWRWGSELKVREYHVRWKPGVPHSEHELLNAQLARAIIPDAALEYLHEIGSEDIVQLVMKALSGFAAGNKIHEVVTAADMKSVRLYNQAHGYTGKAEGEARLDERFCAALRHRIQLGEFATNVKGGQFWFIEGRCFLVWNSDIVESIRAALRSLNLASIPNDLNVLAGALVDDGLFVPHEMERNGQLFRSYLWYIRPKGIPKPLRAVLLKTSRVIMRMPPDNVDGEIVANPSDEYDVPALSEDDRKSTRSAPSCDMPAKNPDRANLSNDVPRVDPPSSFTASATNNNVAGRSFEGSIASNGKEKEPAKPQAPNRSVRSVAAASTAATPEAASVSSRNKDVSNSDICAGRTKATTAATPGAKKEKESKQANQAKEKEAKASTGKKGKEASRQPALTAKPKTKQPDSPSASGVNKEGREGKEGASDKRGTSPENNCRNGRVSRLDGDAAVTGEHESAQTSRKVCSKDSKAALKTVVSNKDIENSVQSSPRFASSFSAPSSSETSSDDRQNPAGSVETAGDTPEKRSVGDQGPSMLESNRAADTQTVRLSRSTPAAGRDDSAGSKKVGESDASGVSNPTNANNATNASHT